MLNKKSVFYSTLLLSISGLILQILSFLYRIVISRLTGPEGMAIYQLIWPVYGIITAVSLIGLTTASTKITAERAAEGNYNTSPLMRVCLRIFLILFSACAAFVFIFSGWISETVLGDARTQMSLLILLPAIFLTGFENMFKSVFHGIKNVFPTVISETIELATRILSGAILLLLFGSDDAGLNCALIIAGMLISEVVSTAIIGTFYIKKFDKKNKKTKEKGLNNEVSAFALPIALSGLLTTVIGSATLLMIPRLLIAYGLPRQDAYNSFGILMGMVSPFLMLPMIFIGALACNMLPKIAELHKLNHNGDVKRKISLSIQTTSLFAMPITAVIITIGPMLCSIIFGQYPDKNFFASLALVTIFSYYQIVFGNILNALNKQKSCAIIYTAAGIIQLIATCLLMPSYGFSGYIYGILICSSFSFITSLYIIKKNTKFKLHISRLFIIPVILSIITGICAKWLYILFININITQLPAIIYTIIASAIIYTILLSITGIKPVKYIKSLFIIE